MYSGFIKISVCINLFDPCDDLRVWGVWGAVCAKNSNFAQMSSYIYKCEGDIYKCQPTFINVRRYL